MAVVEGGLREIHLFKVSFISPSETGVGWGGGIKQEGERGSGGDSTTRALTASTGG